MWQSLSAGARTAQPSSSSSPSLFPAGQDVQLVAITIDEGIAGYREATVQAAEHLARRLGIEHHCISFPDLFGDSLDVFLKGRETQACSICGILRRKALVVAAQRAGATKLATGHNLDDEAQSVLMNVFRGDLPRLIRNSGVDSSGKFIPRIKPLSLISEKEIATYLILKNAWNELPECPYTRVMHYGGRSGRCSRILNISIPVRCSTLWRVKRRSNIPVQAR